jgi:hypothetical protein
MRRKKFFALLLLVVVEPTFAQNQPLDTTNFVVVGGGLSAGYLNSQLVDRYQQASYPALMAKQVGTIFPLPLLSPVAPAQSGAPAPLPVFHENGRISLVAFNPLANLLAPVGQSVLRKLPFPLFTFNISIPFVKVTETINTRPSLPFVREGNLKQTLINEILGYPELVLDNPPSWSQIEYAEMMAPTFAILELGFGDLLDGALSGDPSKITPAGSFGNDYTTVAARLKNTFATILVLNIPDPTTTAYFSTIDAAAQLNKSDSATLMATFGLQNGDLLTLGGLVEIREQLSGRHNISNLSANSILRASAVSAVRSAVQAYNSTVASVAQKNGFLTFDLNAFCQQASAGGVQAGSRVLGGGYSRGFYSNDGIFLTPTAHAVLANRLLNLLNSTFGKNYPLVDVESVAQQDDLVPKAVGPSAPKSGRPQTLPSRN